jgi:hypothetical protein
MLHTFDSANLQGDPNRLAAADYRRYGWLMIILGLLIVGAGIVVLAHNWHLLKILRGGPVPVTPARLRKAESLAGLPSPWVSLDGCKVYDTGVRRYVGRRGVEWRYILVPVEDRYLLTEVHWSFQSGSSLTGYLEEWELGRNGGGILTEVKARGFGDKLLPYQMSAVGDQNVYFSGLLMLGPIVMLVGVIFAGVGRHYLSRQPVPWDQPAAWGS